MFNIRKSIWETNSSSTHAICISNNSVNNIDYYDCSTIYYHLGEYGWATEMLSGATELLSYLMTTIKDYNDCHADDDLKYDENYIADILRKYNIEIECYNTDCYYYVDHVSDSKEWLDAIYNDESMLLNYLFSADSFIITGNDNSEESEEYIKEHIDDIDTSTYNIYYKGN